MVSSWLNTSLTPVVVSQIMETAPSWNTVQTRMGRTSSTIYLFTITNVTHIDLPDRSSILGTTYSNPVLEEAFGGNRGASFDFFYDGVTGLLLTAEWYLDDILTQKLGVILMDIPPAKAKVEAMPFKLIDTNIDIEFIEDEEPQNINYGILIPTIVIIALLTLPLLRGRLRTEAIRGETAEKLGGGEL